MVQHRADADALAIGLPKTVEAHALTEPDATGWSGGGADRAPLSTLSKPCLRLAQPPDIPTATARPPPTGIFDSLNYQSFTIFYLNRLSFPRLYATFQKAGRA